MLIRQLLLSSEEPRPSCPLAETEASSTEQTQAPGPKAAPSLPHCSETLGLPKGCAACGRLCRAPGVPPHGAYLLPGLGKATRCV